MRNNLSSEISFTRIPEYLYRTEKIPTAVFLASHASDAVNGHILYVDGGILAYIGKQPQ